MSEIMEAGLAHLPDEEIEAPSDEGLIQHPHMAEQRSWRSALPCPASPPPTPVTAERLVSSTLPG